MEHDVEKLVAELQEIGDHEARVEAISADLSSGILKYALIDVWTLADLLGLDPNDHADWGRSFYTYRNRMEDLDLDQPCAEHIKLLKGHITSDRYENLKARAEKALVSGGADIRIQKKERRLIEEILTEEDEPFSDMIHIMTTLETSSGDELMFEGLVGDGGDVCELYGPYELARGEGVDLDDYFCIE
jgi:hypothetical protein